MAKRHHKHHAHGREAVAYGTGGYYLSAAQFDYTTAQAPTDGFGGGDMSTATAGAGGDSGGSAAAGGAP